jgi:hypothetical protein
MCSSISFVFAVFIKISGLTYETAPFPENIVDLLPFLHNLLHYSKSKWKEELLKEGRNGKEKLSSDDGTLLFHL